MRKFRSPTGFVGGTNDATTGLTHLGAREYDPANGRFISVDPILDIADSQQINGYAYSDNDPVNLSDPSGLYSIFGVQVFPDIPSPKEIVKSAGNMAAGAFDSAVGWLAKNSPGAAMNNAAAEINREVSQQTGAGPVIPGIAPIQPTEHPAADFFGISHDDPAYRFGEILETLIETGADGVGAVKGGVKGVKAAKSLIEHSGGAKKALKKIFSPCSFTPDTPVLMADGTSKAIGDIQVGDKVKSGDPERAAGEDSGDRSVLATLVNDDEDLVDVTIKTEGATEKTVHTTSNHPFWDDTTRSWTPAGELSKGHILKSESGELVEVAAVRPVAGRAWMHNLTVDDFHTYYVLAGTTPVLVHNTCKTLNLGSGDNPMPNAVNLDIKPNPGVDIVADAESLPFRDGEFATVHAINPFGYQPVSPETARVLKSGGRLVVTAAKSNKWRKASQQAIEDSGFVLESVGEMTPEHDFGIMRRADGGIIPDGANFETRIYRKL
ncbi:polymorphic toxin-type HINT domain-containing protein [Kitasatospora sp. NPDC056531]|uniref:polymorphic toxin-type HINT domain-containing protein n=1 Tax=Kitasatospora sp. NPDC056531 TaxID=3345856 RepID=UPI003684A1EE